MPYISKKQLARLAEIAETATMKTAGFGFPQEKFSAPVRQFGPNVETNPDEFIKSRTAIWRYSNLVHPLNDLIAKIKGNME